MHISGGFLGGLSELDDTRWALATINGNPPLDPFTDQRSFAKPCRGRDERKFAVQAIVQLLDQARSMDEFWPCGRDKEFGDQNRDGHEGIIPEL